MSNDVENKRYDNRLIRKTIKIDDGNNSTALIIPKEFIEVWVSRTPGCQCHCWMIVMATSTFW